jgi:hypothetical protein
VSLLSRLRDKQATKIATATYATFATQEVERGRPVASVATVSVAKSLQDLIAQKPKLVTNDSAGRSIWWKIQFQSRDPKIVSCFPTATQSEILKQYDDAVAAEIFKPIIRQPSKLLTAIEETVIRKWLAKIDETDKAAIDEVIHQCKVNSGARSYYIEVATTDNLLKELSDAAFVDDRRTCNQCLNLAGRGCRAAKRGEMNASRTYEPIRDMLQRCEGYLPKMEDHDGRLGKVRWPNLFCKVGE